MRAAVCVCLLVLAGCGGDEPPEAPRPTQAPPPTGATRLEVTVRPRGGDGPPRRRVVTRVSAAVTAASLAPVPRDVACTEIYGGPATARVSGILRGESVDATFNRVNGCEIARWDRLASLLGRPPP